MTIFYFGKVKSLIIDTLDEACNITDECTVKILQRLSALENEMENVKTENLELKIKNEELTNDVLAIEKIVRPGKIPASCQEHQDRGATETGTYQIKPTVDIEPFSVMCDFRKMVPKHISRKFYAVK